MIIQDGQNYYKNGSWHKYDFTINSEVSGMYNSKIENDVVIRFNTSSAQSYRIEMDTNYVEWLPQNIQSVTASINERNIAFSNLWSMVNVELKPIPLGLKENIILQDNSAPTTFQFKLNTNLKISSDSSRIFFSDSKDIKIFKVPSLFAIDSKNNFFDVHFSISGADDSTYVTLSVKTDSAVFPITIDPSTLIYDTLTATKDNHTRSNLADKNWGAWQSIRVGGGGSDGICFGLLQFDVSSIPNDAAIDTARLRLYCSEYDGSPGYVHVRRFKKEWGEGNGINADADTGASSWNSARRYIQNWDSPGAIATGDTGSSVAELRRDTVGWDTTDIGTLVQDWAMGTYPNYGMKLVVEPDPGSTDAIFYNSRENASNKPELRIGYWELQNPTPPSLSVPGSPDSSTTLNLSCVDTANYSDKMVYAFKFTEGSYAGQFIDLSGNALEEGDTVKAAKTSWQNRVVKDLIPNEHIAMVCVAFFENAQQLYRVSSSASAYTRAQKPDSLRTDFDTDSTLKVISFKTDLNTSGTWYAIYDTTLSKYVDMDGTHKTYAKWYTKSQWNGVFPLAVQGVTVGQTYTFKVRAMNADSVLTNWGPLVSQLCANQPDPPQNLVLIPSNVMMLMWSPNTEQSLKGYIVYRDTAYPPSDSIAFVPKTDSTHTDSSVTLGETYYYWITAVDSQNVESGASDYVTGMPGYILSIPDKSGYEQDTLKIPILTSNEMALDSIYSYEFHIGYDETVVKYVGVDTVGTLSSAFYTIQVHDSLEVLNIAAFDTVPIPGGNDTIIFMKFVIDVDTGSRAGHSDLIFASALIDDDNNYVYTTDGRISVKGLIYGDPSLNDSVTTYDCSLVLQHNIAKKLLNGLQELVADVSGNGLVTVYDASLILKYVIGMIDSFPAGDTLLTKQSAPLPENSAVTLSYSKDEENGIVIVDVSVSGAGDNISAIGVDIRYPKDKLEYDRYALTKLTEKFMAGVNDAAGIVKVGLASGNALESDGKIIRLYFRMKESNLSNPKFELIAAMLNETKINYVTDVAQEEELPKTFELSQNYPNPFNPKTIIRFQIPRLEDVKIIVYNILGQEVKTVINEQLPAGRYEAIWDGTNSSGVKVASGIYIYRFTAGIKGGKTEFTKVRKMVFLK